MNIKFEKVTMQHMETILKWLAEPHMMEFWDNSQEHKNDILNFAQGERQTYFAGTTKYWIGFIDDQPYAFVLSDVLEKGQTDLSEAQLAHMSEVGHTISLDFGIGNTAYLGRGLAAPTLSEFVLFYKREIDPQADTFFIDPDKNNSRAFRVYNKANFFKVGEYQVTHGAFVGQNSDLMVRKFK